MEIDPVEDGFTDLHARPSESFSHQHWGRDWRVQHQFGDLAHYIAWGRWEDLGDFPRVEHGRVECSDPRVIELRQEADRHEAEAYSLAREAFREAGDCHFGSCLVDAFDAGREQFEAFKLEAEANRIAHEIWRENHEK